MLGLGISDVERARSQSVYQLLYCSLVQDMKKKKCSYVASAFSTDERLFAYGF